MRGPGGGMLVVGFQGRVVNFTSRYLALELGPVRGANVQQISERALTEYRWEGIRTWGDIIAKELLARCARDRITRGTMALSR